MDALDQSSLPKEQYEWLRGMYSRGEMLSPGQPAGAFTGLVVNGIPEELNGQTVEWNDARIAL